MYVLYIYISPQTTQGAQDGFIKESRNIYIYIYIYTYTLNDIGIPNRI